MACKHSTLNLAGMTVKEAKSLSGSVACLVRLRRMPNNPEYDHWDIATCEKTQYGGVYFTRCDGETINSNDIEEIFPLPAVG